MRNLNPNDGEGETMHLETRLEATGAPQGLHDLANQLIGGRDHKSGFDRDHARVRDFRGDELDA